MHYFKISRHGTAATVFLTSACKQYLRRDTLELVPKIRDIIGSATEHFTQIFRCRVAPATYRSHRHGVILLLRSKSNDSKLQPPSWYHATEPHPTFATLLRVRLSRRDVYYCILFPCKPHPAYQCFFLSDPIALLPVGGGS